MKKLSILFLIYFLFISVLDANAQRRTQYENLIQRSEQANSYIDHVVIPLSDSTAIAGVFFRLEYDFIPFLKKRGNMSTPNPDDEYFSSVRMGLEIFDGNLPESRRRSRDIPISVFRDNWSDTVWVSTFEQTQSRFDHVQGMLSSELQSGNYHYELQLGRGESNRELPSRRRNMLIPEFSENKLAQFILTESVEESDGQISATLLNYGNNVLYGQDFDLLIVFPNTVNGYNGDFDLNFYKMRPGSNERAEEEPSYSFTISSDQLYNARFLSLERQNGNIRLELEEDNSGAFYAHLTIPNSGFENSQYRLELTQPGVDDPLARQPVNSQWLDMPISLYNLDVSIEMLKFIVSNDELRRINSGSASEKERKFREFWEDRDPSPDTEFNELMTEYYRRIDHAYRNFSSIQIPGFETDQGKTYILYGPPLNVERRLPANSPAREIWEYPDRTLIFEATTGFGDFKLISES